MYQQLPLILYKPPDYDAESFIKSDCNQEACLLLDRWQAWPGNTLCLVGPEGAGKSHMASIWRKETNAIALDEKAFQADNIPDLRPFRGHSLVFDAYHSGISDIPLFHLLNYAQSDDITGLLIIARKHPECWKVAFPDLISRLKSMLVTKIRSPDDNFLAKVLEKLFLDKGLEVSPAMISYLLTRIERSVAGAKDLVEALDAYAFSLKRRRLTREDAKKMLNYRFLNER